MTTASPIKRQEFYTTGEVSTICSVSMNTVMKWCNKGLLSHHRIPNGKGKGDRRIRHKALLKFMREHGIPTDLIGVAVYPVLFITDKSTSDVLQLGLDPAEYTFQTANDPFHVGMAFAQLNPKLIVVDFAYGRGECVRFCEEQQRNVTARSGRQYWVALANEDEQCMAGLGTLFDYVEKKPFDPSRVRHVIDHLLRYEKLPE